MGKKSTPRTTPSPIAPAAALGPRWPLKLRVLVSALVTFHVFAVFVGPWTAIRDQASPLAESCRAITAPYVDALFLSNGYRFFAPEPGPSHLIKYEVTLPDGKIVKGKFPDRTVNRPRLLYHRYFMLSETINTLRPPDNVPPAERVTYNLYVRSFARHLALEYDAKQVKLTLVEHLIPPIEDVQAGRVKLTDEQLFQELPLGTFSGDEL